MNRAIEPGALSATPQTPAPRRVLPRILLHGLILVLAAAAAVPCLRRPLAEARTAVQSGTPAGLPRK
jgi:hypothetical protein